MRCQTTACTVLALIIGEARSHRRDVLLSGVRQTGRHLVGWLSGDEVAERVEFDVKLSALYGR